MVNPEITYYDASEEQADRAMEIAEKSHRSIDQVYKEMGVSPVAADKPAELSESDKAVSLLNALKLDLKASKLSGLTKAVESSHPGVNNRFDSSRIDVNVSREKMYRSRADEAFRRAIGSRALTAAGYPTKNASDEHLIALPDQFYNDFTGKENQAKRTQLRKKLSKIISQNN